MNDNLNRYIAQKNIWRRVFKQTEIDPANITPKQARELLDSIEGDLSPENLHCDGEISAAEARRKARWLNECKQALLSGHY